MGADAAAGVQDLIELQADGWGEGGEGGRVGTRPHTGDAQAGVHPHSHAPLALQHHLPIRYGHELLQHLPSTHRLSAEPDYTCTMSRHGAQ